MDHAAAESDRSVAESSCLMNASHVVPRGAARRQGLYLAAWLLAAHATAVSAAVEFAASTDTFSDGAPGTLNGCTVVIPGTAGFVGAPAAASTACAGNGAAAAGSASASVGVVGATSSSLVNQQTGTAPFSNSTASYRDDHVVFSADPTKFAGDTAPVQIQLVLSGKVNSTALADALARFTVVLFGQTVVQYTVDIDGGVFHCGGIASASPACGVSTPSGLLVGVPVSVPLDTPGILQMTIFTHTNVLNAPGFVASADSQWVDGMRINALSFLLPDGVTVNAPDSGIIGNHFVSSPSAVPLPASLGLFSVELGLLGANATRRRCADGRVRFVVKS